MIVQSARPAIVVGDHIRLMLVGLIACSFALPIRIANAGEVEIPLAIVAVVIGLPTLFALPRMAGGWWLLGSFATGLVSLCAWDISPASSNSYHPYFSFVFFFLPYVAYGAGYVMIRSRFDLGRFVSVSAVVSSLAGLVMAATLVVTKTPVRTEGDILGSLGGLPLYATHGVNSLAITEFILFAFIFSF